MEEETREDGVRLVVAQVRDELASESRYHLREPFGEDAFDETPGGVVKAFREQTGAGAASGAPGLP